MIDLLEAAGEIQEFCDRQGYRFCFIGGLAVLRWSEPRLTRDIDLTVMTGFGGEVPIVETFLARYRSRIRNPLPFALDARVILLQSPNGIGIDVSLGALPFEESLIARATRFEFAPGTPLLTCSAEDLVVMKLFASRPIDIRDAEGVAIRHGRKLEWNYILSQLAPLAEVKGDPGILQEFARLQQLRIP